MDIWIKLPVADTDADSLFRASICGNSGLLFEEFKYSEGGPGQGTHHFFVRCRAGKVPTEMEVQRFTAELVKTAALHMRSEKDDSYHPNGFCENNGDLWDIQDEVFGEEEQDEHQAAPDELMVVDKRNGTEEIIANGMVSGIVPNVRMLSLRDAYELNNVHQKNTFEEFEKYVRAEAKLHKYIALVVEKDGGMYLQTSETPIVTMVRKDALTGTH